MKRRESRRREASDEQHLAVAALSALSREWIPERRVKRRRPATRLVRLAAETRELLAMWTFYRLACVEAMETGHLGLA
jgi:hypothetical protein